MDNIFCQGHGSPSRISARCTSAAQHTQCLNHCGHAKVQIGILNPSKSPPHVLPLAAHVLPTDSKQILTKTEWWWVVLLSITSLRIFWANEASFIQLQVGINRVAWLHWRCTDVALMHSSYQKTCHAATPRIASFRFVPGGDLESFSIISWSANTPSVPRRRCGASVFECRRCSTWDVEGGS